jgi:hypothetical protein
MPSTYKQHVINIRQAAAVLDAYKIAAGCIDCGFNAWPEALHFDHVDPQTKRQSLGWFADRSKLKTKAKLRQFLGHVEAHCVVRCANCHARRTIQERQWTIRRDDKPDLTGTLF